MKQNIIFPIFPILYNIIHFLQQSFNVKGIVSAFIPKVPEDLECGNYLLIVDGRKDHNIVFAVTNMITGQFQIRFELVLHVAKLMRLAAFEDDHYVGG